MGSENWRASAETISAIVGGQHGDPFAVLGPHEVAGGTAIRAFLPGADSVAVVTGHGEPVALERRDTRGFFEGLLITPAAVPYRLRINWGDVTVEQPDVFAFHPLLGEIDDHLLVEGTHRQLYERLGAHVLQHQGVDGVHFAVWAPHARRVSVVGGFNQWDGRRHPMRKRIDSGIWEIFIPELAAGTVYKYEIVDAAGRLLPLKADPFAFQSELRPSTASVVAQPLAYAWGDADFMKRRADGDPRRRPMSVYEVHLGSWRRRPDGSFPSWDELEAALIPYAVDMGYTHLELLPVSEHPLDASWGYQPIGLFSPTSRFGEPQGFARFVDAAHRAGLGVIIDWVPAHFPTDEHGLARFDGTALYEHPDPRRGFHPDWNTAIYDLGRPEVANVLAASALYWLDRFHVDALRVDAVASMLYLDYSRKAGEWLPNASGGNENHEAVAFLRRTNALTYETFPGAITIAEESTAWPGVSQPAYAGGLGFGFKWNMGWMNDTLSYMKLDPVYRRWHHNKLTFGSMYAFSENFVLPLSHDEVVHGKGSILSRMPGDEWQRFANARAYYGFMWGHPGKKLLFMGQDFGQVREWNFDSGLEWDLLQFPLHKGLQTLVRDLNRIYRAYPALHARDCEGDGFRWIVADDAEQSVFAWLRFGGEGDKPVAVLSNMTSVPRAGYRIGLPAVGRWREILNTDASLYGGSGIGNLGSVSAVLDPRHGYDASAEVTLPPLATVFLSLD